MLSDLRTEGDLRGGRVNLGWCWSGSDPLPEFRLQRRRRSYPRAVDDGLGVLDGLLALARYADAQDAVEPSIAPDAGRLAPEPPRRRRTAGRVV